MIVCTLASGSKGNSTYVASSSVKLLLDLGTTSMYVEKKLKSIDVDPNEITGILISHTHSDHINGLKVFIKKYNPTLFLTEKMLNDLKEQFNVTNYVLIDDDFTVGDINVSVIKTSHDASDSNGYILESNGKSVVYVTDTGYINQKNHKKLMNKNVYVFESNHDVEMLMNGNYPYYLKQRILGDKGHLSNKDSAYYLSKFIGNNTKYVVLAHLSHENNDPVIALNTLKDKLKEEDIKFDNIIVSTQEDRTELISI
ncbi:MAG: MBL fold metallo-hydrolase [Bacilli bacterium]|nr:MBL fold metallo-hydrolase [Bacilli bacterium]